MGIEISNKIRLQSF